MGSASPIADSASRAACRSFSCSIFGVEWITGIPRSPTALRNIGPSSFSTMRASPRRPERRRTRLMRWPTTPPLSSARSDLRKSICWASPSADTSRRPSRQAAARAFWARRHVRKDDVDPPTSAQTMGAQRAAITEWRQPRGERFAELKAIKQPTLVVNGDHDIMVPTINSFTLSQNIPNAQLIIYPDAGHGALFQVPELFVAHAEMFLDA